MDKFACPQAPKQLKDMECSSTRDYNPPWKNTITWEHWACTSKKYDYSLTIDPCPGQTTIQAVLQFKSVHYDLFLSNLEVLGVLLGPGEVWDQAAVGHNSED